MFKIFCLYCIFVTKVMGSLAVQKPKEGHRISGVLIKRGFNYHLVNPGDLGSKLNVSNYIIPINALHVMFLDYTELATSIITEVGVLITSHDLVFYCALLFIENECSIYCPLLPIVSSPE